MTAPADAGTLPAPRTPGTYRVAMVCLGNICRSPMAHVVLASALVDAGLDDRVEVESSGTGGWHVGQPMDERAALELSVAGYDASAHRARQYDASWLDRCDLLLAMDRSNLADLGGRSARVRLLGEFDPQARGAEVADPYYGGDDGFEEVREQVERAADELVVLLRARLDPLADL